MRLLSEIERTNLNELGLQLHNLAAVLFPVCRSITGNGVRETLSTLQKRIPLQIEEVPSGTPVFDWTVPKEWNIRDAYIRQPGGQRLVDFQKSNLHVLNLSLIHISEPTRLLSISYAVFCLKKKKN